MCSEYLCMYGVFAKLSKQLLLLLKVLSIIRKLLRTTSHDNYIVRIETLSRSILQFMIQIVCCYRSFQVSIVREKS